MAGFETKTRRRLLQSLAVVGGLLVLAGTGSAMFGCAAVIREETYGFGNENPMRRDQPEWAFAYLTQSRRDQTVIPGLYRKIIWAEPFALRLQVGGDFETLTSFEFRLFADGAEVPGVAPDLDAMNARRVSSHTWGDHYFPTEDRTLDIKWKEVHALEASLSFTAVGPEGDERTYAETIEFTKYDQRRTYTFLRVLIEYFQGFLIH
jgi:hypothetical protein